MESVRNLAIVLRPKVKQASLLWVQGFLDACCLHRVFIYCRRSRKLAMGTGQCFLLNGFIFLGSLFIMNSMIIPAIEKILPNHCPHVVFEEECSFSGVLRLYSFLRFGLLQLLYVLWFYPLYLSSFILSTLWYSDIAKYGFLAIEQDESTRADQQTSQEQSSPRNLPRPSTSVDIGGVMLGIAEQAYSIILLNVFFLQVQFTSFIPYIGLPLNFLLTSWMYAYYCFEYKWNFKGLSLDKRLDFFESNWAFFAGFGSPCILAMFVFSRLVSYGILSILFPLFVLTAAGSDADKLITSQRKTWKGAGLARIPIFSVADYASMKVLSFLQPRGGQHDKTL